MNRKLFGIFLAILGFCGVQVRAQGEGIEYVTVVWESPQSFVTVHGVVPVRFSISASSEPISHITLSVSGKLLATLQPTTDRKYAYEWDTTQTPNGPQSIYAEVFRTSSGSQVVGMAGAAVAVDNPVVCKPLGVTVFNRLAHLGVTGILQEIDLHGSGPVPFNLAPNSETSVSLPVTYINRQEPFTVQGVVQTVNLRSRESPVSIDCRGPAKTANSCPQQPLAAIMTIERLDDTGSIRCTINSL